MRLHEFLDVHRGVLLERCRHKSAQRCIAEPRPDSDGVLVFLQQLTDVLRREDSVAARDGAGWQAVGLPPDLARAAAQHAVQLQQQGYSIDQVVREYGDVCQTVTDLALDLEIWIATSEFRTLNRCLDEAIAAAAVAYGSHSLGRLADREIELASRLQLLAGDLHRITGIALQAHAAIVSGKVGIAGATGALLGHSLNELQYLAEQAMRTTIDVGLLAGA